MADPIVYAAAATVWFLVCFGGIYLTIRIIVDMWREKRDDD